MELLLIRTYHPAGTNGEIRCEGQRVCSSIELPWRANARNTSCIPEGRYELRRRFTARRQHHLEVYNVPGRSAILIHPANDAQQELQGCIAPVTTLVGPGRGESSRLANEKLKTLVLAAMDRNEKVYLTINATHHECYTTDEGTDA